MIKFLRAMGGSYEILDRRQFLKIGATLGLVRFETGLFGVQNPNAISKMNELAQQLAHGRSAFFSRPFTFSWWLRGGEPGSPSDKLSLEGDGGAVKATYIRTRFEPEREPPFLSETFARVIDTDRVSRILRRLFESPLFTEQFKEEDDQGVRDTQKETWTFERDTVRYSKTFYEPLPTTLEDLRASVRELVRLVGSNQR